MAFDFDEARATVEEAKKRGLIRSAGAEPAAPDPKAKSEKSAGNIVLPDWLQDVK